MQKYKQNWAQVAGQKAMEMNLEWFNQCGTHPAIVGVSIHTYRIPSNRNAYFIHLTFKPVLYKGVTHCRCFSGSGLRCYSSCLILHKLLEESHHPAILYLAVDEVAALTAQSTASADQSLILFYTCVVLPSPMLILLFCGIISNTGIILLLYSPFLFFTVILLSQRLCLITCTKSLPLFWIRQYSY